MDIVSNDIISNILSRLSIRSVLQCRCVCKTWCSLITDPQFAIIHFNRANQTNPNIILVPHSNTDGKELFFMEESEELEEPILRATRIDVPFNIESPFQVIGSCNGLLCLSSTHNRNHPIYIFNPTIGQHVKLPELPIPTRAYTKSLLGFGFSIFTQEFKVLQVLFYEESSSSQSLDSVVHVYTLGSNSWRRLGNAPNSLSGQICSSTFVNGSLHWMMIGPNQPDNQASAFSRIVIVSFDLSVEEFGAIPKPNFRVAVNRGRRFFLRSVQLDDREIVSRRHHSLSTCYQLGVLGGCLSVLDCSNDYSIDIWVMKNYNVKESWIKQFSMWRHPLPQLHPGFDMPVCLRKNGDILLLYDSKYLVSNNAESRNLSFLQVVGIQKMSDLEAGASPTSFLAFPHVGSLISPKSAFRVKG